MDTPPRVLILHGAGANRDLDAFQAVELAGGAPEIVHINQLKSGEKHWADFAMAILPGGFSYADALGAGRLMALDLSVYFADEMNTFVEQGKPVIGICNGFQTLVKAGILPSPAMQAPTLHATLTHNQRGHFECRWVHLAPRSQRCLWTRGLTGEIFCPVAHGEGNFVVDDPALLQELTDNDQIALVYTLPGGAPARLSYPSNPNGSAMDIAGICNPRGNVLGLMPHPENHIFAYQNPLASRGDTHGSGLALFANGLKAARER
jgi:phosphoribosylformylglycinamidine synthase